MKGKQTDPEKTIVLDIKLTRGAVVALCCILVLASSLAYLTLTGGSAVALQTETTLSASTGMRQFYLTEAAVQGNQPLTACAAGYHFASFWEIADPSNLRYNTTLGYTQSDSGQGPPAQVFGWVRTGYVSGDSGTGQANCANWTSPLGSEMGSYARLPNNWTGDFEDLGVWQLATAGCNAPQRVWCIED